MKTIPKPGAAGTRSSQHLESNSANRPAAPAQTQPASSGESEIRRYVLEDDPVEAIIGLPTHMFYNTGISTYLGILSNREPDHRRGMGQLIDASHFWQNMRKSLGSKRREMSE